MISSVPNHTDHLIPTGRTNRRGEEVIKPPAVIAYNRAKKGVDVSDQMSSYYTCLRKSLKWYKKVVFEVMLGTCVVNAWVIHNNFTNKENKLDMLKFREKIIEGLLNADENTELDVGPEGVRAETENMQETKKRKRGKSSHRIGKYEGSARSSRKRCAECYKRIQLEKGSKEARRKASKVVTFCEDCDGQPTICISCFKKVHE